MSTATIVSGAPFRICETHPQCIPYEIVVPPANFLEGGLSTTIIRDGKFGVYVDEKRGFMDQYDEGVALAERTVRDILVSQLLYTPDCHPAIFYVPGEHTEASVKKQFPDLVKEQMEAQRKWFVVLVQRADGVWAKNRSMAEISDLHRAAVKFLGLQRDYVDRGPEAMTNCPACFTLVRRQAAVCYACKAVINAEKYKEIQFAGQPPQAPTTVETPK